MFLQKVYKEWRLFFWVLVCFITCQLYFIYKGIENAPFFVYGMFAGVYPEKDSFNVLLIKTDKGLVSPFKLSNREAEMLTNNIPAYQQLKNNGGDSGLNKTIYKRFNSFLSPQNYQFVFNGLSNNSSAVNNYPDWWSKYFQSASKEKFDTVSVIKSTVSYLPTFKKSTLEVIVFTVHPN